MAKEARKISRKAATPKAPKKRSTPVKPKGNVDQATVQAFSDQWTRFERSIREREEDNKRVFDRFFFHFPWKKLPAKAKGFEIGCGRGRFLKYVAPNVGRIDAVDPSPVAIAQAKKFNPDLKNVKYYQESTGALSLKNGAYDFGYSFGVLMCVPDTQAAITECADLLKPGAPFCLYMYYNLDGRPAWYRGLWRASDVLRRIICRLPKGPAFFITNMIAALVYWPLARGAALAEKFGKNVHDWPLSDYRHSAFARMRGTSRDRFGTPLEKRFSRAEMTEMMEKAGFENIKYYDGPPYWCMFGTKRPALTVVEDTGAKK